MTVLEEVIMYTFQQCVYYISKVYILPQVDVQVTVSLSPKELTLWEQEGVAWGGREGDQQLSVPAFARKGSPFKTPTEHIIHSLPAV